MRHKLSAKAIERQRRRVCLETNPYQALGLIICQLRTNNPKLAVTQEKLGEIVNLTRSCVCEIELGNRKLDLFEVKDFITVFSHRNPEVLLLKTVFDNYFPKGNHGTQAIYKQTGALISAARDAAEITREELAQMSGIGRAALWRMESGLMRIYLLEAWVLARLLRNYSVPFRELDNALSNLLIKDTINQLVAS